MTMKGIYRGFNPIGEAIGSSKAVPAVNPNIFQSDAGLATAEFAATNFIVSDHSRDPRCRLKNFVTADHACLFCSPLKP